MDLNSVWRLKNLYDNNTDIIIKSYVMSIYRIRPNNRTYSYKGTVKKFPRLLITARQLLSTSL